MNDLGIAELSLILVAAFAVMALAVGFVSFLRRPSNQSSLRRAHRISILRTTIATSTGLATFAVAVALHILNPSWQGVPFVVGPLAATAIGLGTFAALPPPTIDGLVRHRGAALERRRLLHYSSPRQRWTFIVLLCVSTGAVLMSGLTSKSATDGRYLCSGLFAPECTAGGPYLYPGWFFATPALGLIAALLAAMVLAFRRIVNGPSAAIAQLSDADAALRVASVKIVYRLGSTALILTLGLFLGAAGIPLVNAEVLDTGLSANADAVARIVGIVLVASGAVAIAGGLALAITTLLAEDAGSDRLVRATAESSAS